MQFSKNGHVGFVPLKEHHGIEVCQVKRLDKTENSQLFKPLKKNFKKLIYLKHIVCMHFSKLIVWILMLSLWFRKISISVVKFENVFEISSVVASVKEILPTD